MANEPFIIHPSELRDRLWRLGLVLVDVVTNEPVPLHVADNALHVAITGGRDLNVEIAAFEKRKAESIK